MDYQYLSAFLRFIRREYSSEAAYRRWCQGLVKKIRVQNPSLKFDRYEFDEYGGFDTDADVTVYRFSRGWNLSEADAARILVRAIAKPFVRLWNRSVNPAAMLRLYTDRRTLPDSFFNDSSLFEDFSAAESGAQYDFEEAQESGDEEAIETAQQVVYEAERVNYEAGIGNWREFVDFAAERSVGIGPRSFTLNRRGEQVLTQSARQDLREKLKDYADEIRESLTRPNPLNALKPPTR